MLAREEGISIIKLPPHTTDRLQPLDVSCFKPFKTMWDKAIHKWTMENLGRRITKAEFLNLLGSIWRESFSVKNIQAGFKKTGMFPPDRTSYPESAFDADFLRAYKVKDRFYGELEAQGSLRKEASARKEQISENSFEAPKTPEQPPRRESPVPSTSQHSAKRSLFGVDKGPRTSTPQAMNLSLDRSDDFTSFSKMLSSSFLSKRNKTFLPKTSNLRCPKATILTTDEHREQCDILEKERTKNE